MNLLIETFSLYTIKPRQVAIKDNLLITDGKDKRKLRILVTDECRSFLEKNDNNGEQSRQIIGRIFEGVGEKDLNITIQTIMKMERNLSGL